MISGEIITETKPLIPVNTLKNCGGKLDGGNCSMASRERDKYKKLLWQNKETRKRTEYLKTVPTTNNFCELSELELRAQGLSFENDAECMVVDILDKAEKEQILSTKIVKTRSKGALTLISEIKCPECGREIKMHKYWEAFICESSLHGKKIFEIRDVRFPSTVMINE